MLVERSRHTTKSNTLKKKVYPEPMRAWSGMGWAGLISCIRPITGAGAAMLGTCLNLDGGFDVDSLRS